MNTTTETMRGIGRRREKQTRYLSQAIQLEEAVNPHIIRATMAMIPLALLAFLVWAGFTNIYEVAHAPGEVVPYGHEQTVQHLEGGIVKEILVSEGDMVSEGQKLIVLDEGGVKEDVERARSKQLALRMQAERLRAFVEDREPNFSSFTEAAPEMIADQQAFFLGMRKARDKEAHIIEDQIAEKKQAIVTLSSDLGIARGNYGIADDIYRRRASLLENGYASQMRVLEDKKNRNDHLGEIKRLESQIASAKNELSEYGNRLESLAARHRDEAYEKLALVAAEEQQNIEIVKKLEDRLRRLDIHAPAGGMVKGLAIHTIGSVIQPGQTIMEIVPLDKKVEVRIRISPQDRGHVDLGQKVQVKFSTYDFSRYGAVEGTLAHISATTFVGEGGERYYQGRILLDEDYVGGNRHNRILPGMTVMSDVITGEKTILQYLLKPIHLSLQTAFRER